MDAAVVRQAVLADADQICEIEKMCFSDPWSLQSIVSEFTDNPRAYYVVALTTDGTEHMEETGIIGYAGLWWIGDEGHITNVAVRPGYRGRGIGGQLLSTLFHQTGSFGIRHYTLEVRESNTAARRLYEKYGFTIEGIRKGYYQKEKEDALIMWRHEETDV